MSDQKHGKDELFITKATDSDDSRDDSVSTTKEDESKRITNLDEENNRDLDPAEKARLDLKEGAIRKIKSGEKTLEDYSDKPWLQKLITDDLKAEQQAANALEESKTREIARKIAQEEMEKEREKHEFDALKGKLNAVGTTKAQRATIEAEFTRLRDKLGSKDALDTAIRLAGVDLDDISTVRRATSIPTLGDKVVENDVNTKIMNLDNLSQKEINELAKSRSKTFRGR